jgi:integrase
VTVARASKPKKVVVHGNVRWQLRWRDDAGKQQKKNFATSREANAEHDRINGELRSGTYVDPKAGQVTVREYAELWREAQPHRPKTVARVRTELHKHVYPTIGERPIGSVRPSEVQAFITGLSASLAPGSVRNIRSTLAAIFGAAVRDGLRAGNPCNRIKMPPVARGKVKPLTVEELGAIIDTLPERYRSVAVVGAGTGLRPGELFGLQRGDVDFLGKTIRVERQVLRHGVSPLKNRAAYRTIPVGDSVVKALSALTSPASPAGEFMFRGPDGGPVSRDAFDGAWARARQRTGLLARTHDLRHFYASALIRAGLSVKVVSERLGHTNAAMTLNVYSHLWPDDEDRTRQALDGVLADVPRMRPGQRSSARSRRSGAKSVG